MKFIISQGKTKRRLEGDFYLCGSKADIEHLIQELKRVLPNWSYGWLKICEPSPNIPFPPSGPLEPWESEDGLPVDAVCGGDGSDRRGVSTEAFDPKALQGVYEGFCRAEVYTVKDVEATLLAIPGVTEAQVFAKLLVRCEFPMTDETIIALQEAQDWIEHETGWKVEMTVSAGKEPKPMRPSHNEGLFVIADQEPPPIKPLAEEIGTWIL